MKRLIFVLCTVALLSSCHSSKKASEGNITSDKAKVETRIAQPGTNYTAKLKVKVEMDGKDISTTGSLKMRMDEVILVTLVDPYLGAMEIGRMELTNKEVLIIDRMNKQYLAESYDKLSMLAGTPITFDMIQQLFWGEALREGSDGITLTIPVRKPVKLSLKTSNVGSDSNWEANTKVSSKYTKVSLDALFKSLMNNEQ